jgi:murein L,D-transpeptidase YcbB/YkuD
MRNFNPLLIITVFGLFSSFYCYANKERMAIDDDLFSKENTLFFENNDSALFFESILPMKKLKNTSILELYKSNISDSVKSNCKDAKEDEYVLSAQYIKLQKVLEKYQTIEKSGQWKKIDIDHALYKNLKPNDSGATVKQIRERLFIVGDLKQDSKSNIYDQEMMAGVLNYKKRHGLALNYELTLEHINQMNEPISNRIRTIKLNMERCLEMPEDLSNVTEYIIINIPSYRLFYVKDGKNEFVTDVFVGAKWSETQIFSSMMDRIVFSPYWNIPQSIIDNELKLKMYADKNYLKDNNMEWNGGHVRQKPGPKNSLGLVKFMFPNPYDIYIHDTPAKSLFLFEKRTFSHGCVNVNNAKGLAEAILKNDPDWPTEKIDNAMNGEQETAYELKNKIPVYIGYFTAWVSYDTGEISFFEDIYGKDSNTEKMQNSSGVVMD